MTFSNFLFQGVFNNAARSSTITVKSLDRLYESLQKFGRFFPEWDSNPRPLSSPNLTLSNYTKVVKVIGGVKKSVFAQSAFCEAFQ